ncbi:MAG: M20/M25/M40 family metallo-hydrolase, partial [Anaerolineaceae bacterium]|nr:M20/M25/M40 family metallo-hydrolase [Anaerolineaceae bacterium]
MKDILPFLKELLSAPGLSGNEAPIRELVENAWRPLVDEIGVGRLGSLHALRRGNGAEPRPRVLLAAHMDAIGLIVTSIQAGLLHFTQIGGIDARILPGQRVLVHGRNPLIGVVVQPPDRLLPPGSGEKPVAMEHLLIDIGLAPERVATLVRPGDLISFDQPPIELSGDVICGHSLDNRASVASLTVCLRELQSRLHLWDVYAVATSQEEVTLGGAQTAAFEIHPDLAIAIDVTFAKGPGITDYNAFGLGKGLTLGWGPNAHPYLHDSLKELADDLEIPYQVELMPRHSGTDAYAIQVAQEGIPSMVVGIPLRYMHTPVEIVSMKDIRRVGRLLAEYVCRL